MGTVILFGMARHAWLRLALCAACALGLALLALSGQHDVALFALPVAVALGLPLTGRFVGAQRAIARLARFRSRPPRRTLVLRPPAAARTPASATVRLPWSVRGPPWPALAT